MRQLFPCPSFPWPIDTPNRFCCRPGRRSHRHFYFSWRGWSTSLPLQNWWWMWHRRQQGRSGHLWGSWGWESGIFLVRLCPRVEGGSFCCGGWYFWRGNRYRRWAGLGVGTLAVSSKRSWIYFSMMLDLPTDCPPKKTTFILVFPVTVLLIEWFIIQISVYIFYQSAPSELHQKGLPLSQLKIDWVSSSSQFHATFRPVWVGFVGIVVGHWEFATVFADQVAFVQDLQISFAKANTSSTAIYCLFWSFQVVLLHQVQRKEGCFATWVRFEFWHLFDTRAYLWI